MTLQTFHADVLVVGGGAAGIAAAVGAARSGVSVILLERHAFPGGKATAAMIGTVCGLYLRSETHHAKFAMEGFPKEFGEKLKMESQTKPVSFSKGLYFLPYDHLAFKLVCDNVIKDSGVNIFFHTVLSGCYVDAGKIKSAEAISLDRKIVFEPKVVVDCTGEALVSTLSETEILEDANYQAPALTFSMDKVRSADEFALNVEMGRIIARALEEGNADKIFERISIVPGSLKKGRVHLKIGFLNRASNSINKVSELEIFGRKIVNEIAGFLKSGVDAFKDAKIESVAAEVGIRTGRRSVGKYILTEEEVLSCKKFEDGIANGAWPIEFWGEEKRVKMTYFDEDDYYQIPAGCLHSKKIDNLFFAGRNISATENAIASARVIGTCLGTGYAAGKMAACQVWEKDLNEAIREIRTEQVLL